MRCLGCTAECRLQTEPQLCFCSGHWPAETHHSPQPAEAALKSPSPPKQLGHHLRVWNPELQCPLCRVWFGIQSMFRHGEGRKAPLPLGCCEGKITATARRHPRDIRACRRNSAGPALLANQKRKRKSLGPGSANLKWVISSLA